VVHFSTNTVWIGTNKNGILSFNGTEWILHEEYKKNIVSIAIGEDNTKWFGDFKGSVISFNGELWNQFQVVSSMWFLYSVTVSPDNSIWVSTNFGLYNVENGEKRLFNEENGLIESYCRKIASDSNGDIWIAGYWGLTRFDGIQFTHYLGFTGPVGKSVYSIAIDHQNVKWFGHNSNFVSSYNNKHWSSLGNIEYEYTGFDIAVDGNNVKWIAASRDGILSYNDKTTKLYQLFYLDGYGDVRTLHPKCIVVDQYNYIWVGTIGGIGLGSEYPGYISRYNGNNFSIFIEDSIFIHYTNTISLTIDSHNNLWFFDGDGLHYYNGVNKNNIDGYLEKYPNMDKIYSDYTDIIWGVSEYGLSKYDPKKNIWIHYTTDNSDLQSNLLYTVVADNNNTKWIGTDAGVSRFDGDTWTTFNRSNSGLCDNKVNAIAVEKNNTIWFGTDNGVSKYTGEVIVTGVDEEDEIPEALPVIHSYPNPFNPSTTIEFTLPESGFTTLSIYNISGQKVRELATGYITAGTHSLTWDGRDDSGEAVSSGVYITRLEAGRQVAAGRMVFLK